MSKGDEPAFPVNAVPFKLGGDGLSKREYYAAMALQRLCSQPETPEERSMQYDAAIAELAECAVDYADALLIALGESSGY